MSITRSDAAWPVVMAAVLFLGGAATVELTVGRRHVDSAVVQIATSAPQLSDEEGGAAPEGKVLDEHHAQARRLARRGDYEDAIQGFRQVVETHPGEGRAEAELGYWLLADDRDAEALIVLEEAADHAPRDAWVALTLGRARSRMEDLHGAEAAYRRALALRPGYTTARVSLGIVLRKAGRLDEAVEILEEASSFGGNEETARALVALGRAYLAAGRPEEARATMDEALLLAPASVEIRLGIGRAWLYEGGEERLGEARAVLEETAFLAPDVPEAHSALGQVLEREGELDEALQRYRTALQLDEDYAFVQRRLIHLALDAEDLRTARLQASYLVDAAPEVPEHHLLAGLVAAKGGDSAAARAAYLEALERTGGAYPEALFNLALLEKRQGNLDAAVGSYRGALELRPDYGEAANNLALALEAAGEGAEAEATWRDLLDRNPSYVAAWLNLGGLLSDQERYDEAVECNRRALAWSPGLDKALLNMGVAYSRAGRSQDAIRTYRELVDQHPTYEPGWYNLGIALKRSGDVDGAREAFLAAVEADHEGTRAMRSLASLERTAERYDEAIVLYEDLVDRDPADTSLRIIFTGTLRKAGRYRECAEQASAVLAIDPTYARAGRERRRCLRRLDEERR